MYPSLEEFVKTILLQKTEEVEEHIRFQKEVRYTCSTSEKYIMYWIAIYCIEKTYKTVLDQLFSYRKLVRYSS